MQALWSPLGRRWNCLFVGYFTSPDLSTFSRSTSNRHGHGVQAGSPRPRRFPRHELACWRRGGRYGEERRREEVVTQSKPAAKSLRSVQPRINLRRTMDAMCSELQERQHEVQPTKNLAQYRGLHSPQTSDLQTLRDSSKSTTYSPAHRSISFRFVSQSIT